MCQQEKKNLNNDVYFFNFKNLEAKLIFLMQKYFLRP